jgi:class I lanthipeptide synthase
VRVEEAVLQARLQSDNPTGPQWTQYGFAQGYAGLVLFWGHLDRCFPGQGWDAVAHEHLQIAAEGAATQTWLGPGAFSGIGGLAFAADYVSRSGARYGKLLKTLEDGMVRSLAPRITYLNNLNHGAPTSAFDLISGLSGAIPFLLSRRESPEVERTLTEVVRSLIAVTNEDDGLPGWHSPPYFSKPADDFMLQQYPDGYLNCGLAHGVPGPLGALAVAHLHGVECEGLTEAIDRAASWLVEHRLDDEWGINWPSGLGLRPPGDPAGRVLDTVPSGPAQSGWCYGSPGVARSLYHAGVCLKRQDYCEFAIEAIECVLRRPRSARRLESPTFCHGVAGLLEIVLRFAHDTGSETIAAGASALIDQILAMFEPETMLGFRSMEFAGKRVDQPGLLDGAPGAALVMLSIACDAEPAWDRIFLLS